MMPLPNTFTIGEKQGRIEAVICFDDKDGVPFSFMDKIADLIILRFQCFKYIEQEELTSSLTSADRVIYLFDIKNKELIESYHQRKVDFYKQNLILRILKWGRFKKQEKEIIDTALCEINTNHDFPFISVYSKINNEKDLEEIILEVSKREGFNFRRNDKYLA
jgi:hypothetical protein